MFFCCVIATSSLTIIAPSVGDFTKAAAGAKDVLSMISREPKIDSASTEGLRPDKIEGRIELRNVTFKYPARPTVQVLDGISLVFEEGKTTAIVGSSGSGKSTIVALAERWYDPESGDILLDGHSMKDLNIKWLRSQIGLVQQEPMLFNDTIYVNVAHGLQGTGMETLPEEDKRRLVSEACIEANADEFIRGLPEGYDTRVGERASFLSGGQKQRIAIARSIISNPRILLLDEATSALDPKSEGIVQEALDQAAKSRTTVIIAHRLSTIKKSDRIVVLSKGAVVEEGTHESLIAAEGAYYRLVNAQQLAVAAGTEKDPEYDTSRKAFLETAEITTNIDRVETQHSTRSVKSGVNDDAGSQKIGLLKCLGIIFYEHRKLWVWFSCGVFSCVLGGAVFPAQAILFSRIVTVFDPSLPGGRELQKRGDFWALMFFILALGTWVGMCRSLLWTFSSLTIIAYAGVGYFGTSVAFIMSRVYRSQYFTAMITQDISYFDIAENSSSSLTARLSSDPQNLHDLIQGNLCLIIIVIVNLTSSIILSLVVGWRLAIVVRKAS